MTNQRRGRGGILGWSVVGAVGGWLVYSALGIDHNVPLPPAIPAEQKRYNNREAGFLSYYVDTSGSGTPLVLIHSINAAGSAYEMRPIFEHYRGKRPVYALDLPGFGFSERANRVFSPTLYAQAIITLLEKIGEPADVIALSLGGEFAAMAAHQRPDLVHSLTLISPTGFSARQNSMSSQNARQSNVSDNIHRVLSVPLWGQALYDLLGTRQSIQFFLAKNFEGQTDVGLNEYAYLTTHQGGARHAPLYFVSGQLFTPTIRHDVYEKLTQPVLVIYDRDPNVRFDMLPMMLENHTNWHATRVAPTKGLPQFEQMQGVADALDDFWSATAL